MSQRKKKLERKIQKQNLKIGEKEYEKNWKGVLNIIKNNWKFLLILSLGVVVLYWNSLKGDFVSDDYASISQNPMINNFKYMFNGGNAMTFSTYLIYKLFGFASPVPYHVFNLLCYLISIYAIYIFFELVFDDSRMTKISILLFAIHPIHVEAVSWISGRIYLLLAIFVVGALIARIGYLETRKPVYLVVCGILFLLGFLTDKPRPFAFFLILGVYMLYTGIKRYEATIKKWLPYAIGTLVLLVILSFGYIERRISSVNSGYNASESIFYNPFFQYPTGLTKYFQLLLVPTDLTLYHTMYILPAWLNWSVFLTYLVALVYFYFKDKRYFFGLAFIAAAVAPSMAPVKVSWLVAERYMYLGSAGFCIILGLLIKNLWEKSRIFAAVVMACLIVLFSFRTYLRNIDWQTNHKLWVNTVQVSPNSHNAWNNIGDDYDKLQQYDNSIKGFGKSYEVKPNYADAYHNQANIFFKTKRYDLARWGYGMALYYSPELVQSYISLTQIDLSEKRLDLAYEHASKAVQVQPNNPMARYVLGFVLAQAGKLDESIAELKNSLGLDPSNKMAKDLLTQVMEVKNQKGN